MSFYRSILLISIVSVLVSFGLFFLGSVMGYDEFKGGYAVLTTDVSVEDKTLRSLLKEGESSFGGAVVSESSQWVMLDNFDSLRAIPLDEYFTRVAYFDPRNDGYADKLKDIFIRDGKRFVYIPLKAGNWNSTLLDKQFADLLGDIPFSVEYIGAGRPLRLYFIMYGAASLCLLIICFIYRKSSHCSLSVIVLIPVLAPLSFFGASGIGCAALFFGLFLLLKDPINEVVSFVRFPKIQYKNHDSARSGFEFTVKRIVSKIKRIYKEIIQPYSYFAFIIPAFTGMLALMVIFSSITLLFLAVTYVAAISVFLFTLKIIVYSNKKRKRFIPVLIMKRRYPEFAFSFYMMPFVAAAILSIFISPYISASYMSNEKFDFYVTEADYHAHLVFQSTFSTRQFGTHSADFPSFFFDTDGLPSLNTKSTASRTVNTDVFPPFPLKQLMNFFHDINTGVRTDTGYNTDRFSPKWLMERLSLLLLVLFLLPGFIFRRKNIYLPKINLVSLKRFAVEIRRKGISRNKTLLYNGRNPRHNVIQSGRALLDKWGLRKDA